MHQDYNPSLGFDSDDQGHTPAAPPSSPRRTPYPTSPPAPFAAALLPPPLQLVVGTFTMPLYVTGVTQQWLLSWTGGLAGHCSLTSQQHRQE